VFDLNLGILLECYHRTRNTLEGIKTEKFTDDLKN